MSHFYHVTTKLRHKAGVSCLTIETPFATLDQLCADMGFGPFYCAKEWKRSARPGNAGWFKREILIRLDAIALVTPTCRPGSAAAAEETEQAA